MGLQTGQDLCNACQSEKTAPLSLPSGHQAVRCLQCGLVWCATECVSKELYEGAYDKKAEGFTWDNFLNTYAKLKSGGSVSLNWFEKRFIDEVLPFGGKKLLEVGCGVGRFLKACLQNGWEVYGIDISEKAVSMAREILVDADIRPGMLEESFWPKKYFDVIAIWEVIEHVEDPYRMLCQARELLGDDGLLTISTPD